VRLEFDRPSRATLRDDAAVFGVAAQAHPPRQFKVQLRLRAKVVRVQHAWLPVSAYF
jgi:hypothetical protein